MSSDSLPKAILYSWPTSVWSTVPRLCLREKGYGENEYVIKQVDISRGENFAPSYLKLNMNGTIPTLAVPMIETTGPGVDTRFRTLRDTITICDFLDQARSSHSSRTVSDRPAPTLAPATIEGKALSDIIIDLVHRPSVDPNFLQLAAASPEELKVKAHGPPGEMLNARKSNLEAYVAEAEQLAKDSVASGKTKDGKETTTYEQRMVAFLKEKEAANKLLWEVFNGQAGSEREQVFFEASKKAWNEGVPDTLSKLEDSIKGLYALGDQVSLADLHVIAWMARLISLAGGGPTPGGVDKLQAKAGGTIGPKVRAFWAAWVERSSFKQEYPGKLH
ncbi:hypothetical protein EHS25_007662 [Saitozyma podzolica]|uniref:GST N-terminal domain-containing protein n=1 Tax=Saitozyma podzolica TaxID=1890683 RepID=A0A427YQC3_9TREE|nr:hypothetical protein EHS25_007662 [Saitozyma podzolica]